MRGLDTNVILRFVLRDDASQAALADAYIERWCTAVSPCRINRIVLCEVVWVLEAGYGYERNEVAGLIEDILRTTEFAVENAEESWRALRAYRNGAIDFSDALLGRTNRAAGCEVTGTFDRTAGQDEEFELLTSRRATRPGFRSKLAPTS